MSGLEIFFLIVGLIIIAFLALILRAKGLESVSRKRDYKVKYVICAAHGIRTDGKWIKDLFSLLKDNYPEYIDTEITRLIPVKYGYVLASICVIGFVRNYLINWMRRKLESYCMRYPAASFIYFGHSYGTLLGYEALRRSDNIYLDKMILVASVVSSHETFEETLGMGKVREIYCFCSKEDEVCKYNPFGHSGYWGFLRGSDKNCYEKPFGEMEVYNYCRDDLEHSGYFNDEDTLNTWLSITNPVLLGESVPEKNWLCPFITSEYGYPPACVREICKFYDEQDGECIIVKSIKGGFFGSVRKS